ncbi:MAG: 1-(5-phosphoribosyl)-5-[(5-phosphoribosylamino)methylideneamino]imidazole-4-carboxamide isomerase [Peptococcaceae bacterium]|nr:1-(5-phosphoribosyl)-5-[(5-phosphoribosylamino)methylideneamino]imidazole-4-carboxamide isomerase [Peptococcaceae bacterium]
MLIFPAIDLRNGRCVRLLQGRLDQETVYSSDPRAVAASWERQGAPWLHVVDLDGAFTGAPQNEEIIKAIVAGVKIPVQVGGGIRNLNTVRRYLEMGVARVILGTAAVADPGFLRQAVNEFGERVCVGLDCRDGQVCIEGWDTTASRSYAELVPELEELGVQRIIFTDIRRDGTLHGPNLDAVADICAKTGLKVIASGGVARLEDIIALKEMAPRGVEGVIIGKALYAGTVKLKDALRIAEGE